MTFSDLVTELSDMYAGAPKGEKTTFIILFAIKYAKELESLGKSLKSVVYYAGLRESYVTELNKGINLSKYVKVI